MKKNHNIQNIEQISRYCYFAGLGIGFLSLISIILIFTHNIPIIDSLPVCTFYDVTGYYCPGCGGTRAVMAMLQGKIWTSIYYHPFVVYMTVYYILFEGSHTLDILTHGKIKGIRFCPMYFYVGIALIIIQWLIKNYLKFKFGFIL